jgi:hypothetical protein
MPESEKFQLKEISQEIVEEYYKEKGVSLEQEKKETESYEYQESPEEQKQEPKAPAFTSAGSKKIKEKEEEKKLVVKEKIKNLLKIAEEKGLQRSIKEAEKTNDPFLLDLYHDVLAKDAVYKRYLKE